MAITTLSIPYPDFVLNTIMDPDHFDLNNAAFQDKINEIISEVNTDVANLLTHKSSSDHDGRYYTETELNNGQLDSRYYTETELSTGGVLDSRYYTETESDTKFSTKSEVQAVVLGQIPNFTLMPIKDSKLSKYRTSKDSNGIWTQVDYKRTDGTLAVRSVLSGGTSPNYTTRTVTYYDTNGTTVLATYSVTISYDLDGDTQDEVVI